MISANRAAGLLLALSLLGSTRHAGAAPATVTLLHANDVYLMEPVDGLGGFGPFLTLLERERAQHPASITTFGGDLLSPSLLSGITRGEQMIELTDAIGVQLAVPGNHEFDFGPELASTRFAQSHYPWLASNLRTREGALMPGTIDHTIVEVAGYRLGFLGLVTPETVQLSAPGPDLVFADPIASAATAAAALRAEGADLVVALTHLPLADDRALAARVAAVDIVLGGHDHDPSTFYEGGKLILKAAADLHYLAAVDLSLDRVKGKDGKEAVTWRPSWRYESTAGVPSDSRVVPIIAKWNARLGQELAQPLGQTTVELDTRRSTVRFGESNMGDLVADALRSGTGAEVAIMNGGGLRGDRLYPAGTVLTRGDIQAELPFGNTAVLLEVTGADLRQALENGVSQVESGAGRFPQVSGLAFTWDPHRPAGQRITAVSVADTPLDPTALYRLATNDYMARGGDAYTVLTHARTILGPIDGPLLATTVMGYITALGGNLAPHTEGRIKRLD